MLSADHVSVGVSSFDNEGVLSGRPVGGCAIFRRKTLYLTATLLLLIADAYVHYT